MPCSFAFRQCRSCCTPKDDGGNLPLEAEVSDGLDMDNTSTPRRRSPAFGRQGQSGKSTSDSPNHKKNRPRVAALPDNLRRNKYTARQSFQESPSSHRSMVVPGPHFDTGYALSGLRENPTLVHTPLGPVSTLQDAHGQLYAVVPRESRSRMSLPTDRPEREGRCTTPPSPPLPAPNQSRAESLLSINMPNEKEARKK